jgi:hypothetical protein
MTTWNEFYNQIKDPSWPVCNNESDFTTLPLVIQAECINVFGYTIGAFEMHSKLPNRPFPIVTDTACQLKWS